MTVTLTAGEFVLVLSPERGGSVLRFDMGGEAIFRPTNGPHVLDLSCFPLVPFSNRIAEGRFQHAGRTHQLAPNFPSDNPSPHTLHGFGWLSPWTVIDHSPASVTLEHVYSGGEWPWPYVAQQSYALKAAGLTCTISLTNTGDTTMPGGLGLHPYFPCNDQTRYLGLHRGETDTCPEGLPRSIDLREAAIDWWDGAPVVGRNVDTVYTDRQGELQIIWPDRGLRLTLQPSDNLGQTVVYSPQGADFFCVEPVSHVTDALNHPGDARGMTWLKPGETMSASVRFKVSRLASA